jgi:hypothetical protein
MVDPLERPIVAKPGEPPVNRLPWRQILGPT